MIDRVDPRRDEERRTPISPQMAWRVAVMSFVAFAVFGVIFFRLWYLQVLSGDQYLAQAQNNQTRTTSIQAPRGQIVDRNGRVLVENEVSTIVQLEPERLPEQERTAALTWGQEMTAWSRRPRRARGARPAMPPIATPQLRERYRRLGRVLGLSAQTIHERVMRSLVLASYARVTLRTGVPASVRDYLLERQEQFPGVNVERTYLRRYPQGELGAQILGTIGEISDPELKLRRFRGLKQGAIVGKSGIEYSYDRYLRGIDGQSRIVVDALGRPQRQFEAVKPDPGRSVRLTLDFSLQKAGEQALQSAIDSTPGTAGSFVAMDPRNGSVLAMGSNPSFDPSILSRPITQGRYDELLGKAAGSPQFNRAIAGAYPTGSTFKPITSLAGLASGLITPFTTINDPGFFSFGGRDWVNAGRAGNGAVSLVKALSVSSDVYYYILGMRLDSQRGAPLQRWARRLGLGHPTGIDLPGERGGTIPDRRWRAERAALERRCRHDNKIALDAPSSVAAAEGCGISDMRPWSTGDNMNAAVGQGDVQATPLQMAVAYATIANGGHVVRPHFGGNVEDANGAFLQRIEQPRSRTVHFGAGWRDAILAGLHSATVSGTSSAVFKGWNQGAYPVYGKTGTAERPPNGDQSWFVTFVRDPRRPIVIAMTVENGGFGAEAAAPAACRMLAEWYRQPTSGCSAVRVRD
jgi:penicillin-binding protein 2